MINLFDIDFDVASVDNHLWSNFVDRIGLQKASLAIRQSLDLQYMQGNNLTIPMLIVETCGTALVNITNLRIQSGLLANSSSNIIIYSSRNNSYQLLKS
tara:strand:+ start:227 stop:523 length:297 start_codon:yes stop_codon:yes gene_type:complete